MPRIAGYRQRRHQPFYDTLVRTTGNPAPAVATSTNLFGAANVGQIALTNLQVAGQLASDQTFLILALRAWLHFDGTNSRALFLGVTSQLFFTLTVGDKPEFTAPCWYFPAGGGIYGFDSGNAVFNHGYPSHESILKLGKPIALPVRQNFSVTALFVAIGASNILTLINTGAQDDQKEIKFFIDGLQTRDVQ